MTRIYFFAALVAAMSLAYAVAAFAAGSQSTFAYTMMWLVSFSMLGMVTGYFLANRTNEGAAKVRPEILGVLPGTACTLRLDRSGTLRLAYASRDIMAEYALGPGDLSKDLSPLFAAMSEADAAKAKVAISISARDLTPLDVEFILHHPVRGGVWARGLAQPVRARDGETYWHGFIEDITAQKTIEAQSAELAALRTTLLKISRDLIDAGTDESELAGKIFDGISGHAGIGFCLNYAVSEDGLALRASRGITPELAAKLKRLSLGEAVCGNVALRGTVISVDARRIESDSMCHLLREAGAQAFVCFPLCNSAGGVRGTLSFGALAQRAFLPEQIELLSVVANHFEHACIRLEAEQKARDERMRLQYALEVAKLGLFDHDLTTGRFYTSDLFRNIVRGDLSRDWDLRELLETLRPEERAQIEANMAKAHDPQGDGLHHGEYRVLLSNNDVRFLAINAQTQFAGDGDARRPVRTIGTIADISARKLEEQRTLELLDQLATSRAEALHQKMLFQAVFECAPDAILLTDISCFVTNVNPAFENLFRYRAKELTGTHTAQLYDRDRDRSLIAKMAAGYARQPVMPAQLVEFRRQDGSTFSGVLTGATLTTAEGVVSGYVGLIRDVSEEHRLHEARQESRRLETIGRLAGGIAHDFNNALTVISANLQLMEGAPLNPSQVRYLKEAEQAVVLGSHLTTGLMTFARRRTLSPSPINLNELILSTISLLERSIGDDIVIETDLVDPLAPILVDRTEMQTALLNLALNARDAMPLGGRILIQTQNGDERAPPANSEDFPGNWVEIRITDNGEGMSSETLAQAFDPFFTTKEVGKGSGLGLAIVHGFIRQSAGDISLRSAVGQGTTVTIKLPAIVAQPVAADSSAELAALPQVHGERVLVVEDNASVRRAIVGLLDQLGYRTTEAIDGRSALVMLEQAGDSGFDLVFTDVSMPGGMSGIELAIRIRERWPKQPVLMTSGFPIAAEATSGIAGRRVDVLRKPYHYSELARQVRKAIDGEGAAGTGVYGRE